MEEEYGDFEEVVEGEQQPAQEGEAPIRIRKPRDGEILGVIVQRLGGNRMEVRCVDGKVRNCRVPGRFKRSMWLRPKDVVLVKSWTYDDSKADVVFHYNPGAAHQLRKRGLLDSLKDEF
ncbi:translation initiation factor eIF-1A [Candidatus Pacearchaeota archaeon]|nr:translation initiation factor eIF-1A [Candidatus Pacearchaeota archaeon]